MSAAGGKADASREIADRVEGKVASPIAGAEGTALIPAGLAQAAASIAGMSAVELDDFLRAGTGWSKR